MEDNISVDKLYETIQKWNGVLGKISCSYEREYEYVFEDIGKKMGEIRDLLEKLPDFGM